jgi:hypothetical protein
MKEERGKINIYIKMYREAFLVPYRLCSIVAFPMFREAVVGELFMVFVVVVVFFFFFLRFSLYIRKIMGYRVFVVSTLTLNFFTKF